MKKRRLMLCSIISLIMVFVMAVPMTVSAADTAMKVAKIGNNEYATLEEAVVAAKDGDTVTLLTATSINANLAITKNITLNLAGQTLTANANIQAKGQLNITDTNGGNIVLKKDTTDTTQPSRNDGASIISQGTSAKVTLDKGTITVDKSLDSGYAFYALEGGTVVVNGGTVDSLDAALSGNNTTGDMNFEVNGGVLTAQRGPAIYMPGQNNLTITGGTLNGGISLRMGHVKISGGTINATTGSIDSPSEYYSYSGNAWFPDALYVFGGTYKSAAGNDLVLNITGGTFNCANGQGSGIAIYDLGKTSQKMETSISGRATITTNAANRDAYQVLSLSDIGVTNPKAGFGTHSGDVESDISGGTFSDDPGAYVAGDKAVLVLDNDEYLVIYNDDNYARVLGATHKAVIRDTPHYYLDKEDAEPSGLESLGYSVDFYAMQPGGTIDYDQGDSITVPNGKSVKEFLAEVNKTYDFDRKDYAITDPKAVDGYKFLGWYNGKAEWNENDDTLASFAYGEKFDFDQEITKDTEVFAAWEKVGSGSNEPTQPGNLDKPSKDNGAVAKADKSAKTGDDFNLFAVGGVALAAIIAMAAVAITGRRHRQR